MWAVQIPEVFKYSYGLLGLRPADLKEIDVADFIDMVEGSVLWTEEKLELQYNLQEHQTDWIAWFSANIMVSSGNFKKSTKPEDIKKGLFKTQAELKADEDKEATKRNAETEKAKVMKSFGLTDAELPVHTTK